MNNNYCPAIDVGLFVYTSGHVKTCCSGSQWLGDLNKEPIQKIFSSKKFIEIRNNLRNNQKDKYCEDCQKLYDITPTASQKSAFEQAFSFQEKQNLKLIDVRWSNVCNLTCRYCNVQDSSSWSRLLNIKVDKVDNAYDESLFNLIENNKDTISKVYLLGGEPLLQKNNIKLLDIVKKDASIDVLTNLSVKLNNNLIYAKLKSMPNVIWHISFDNIGSRFEYVRAGSQWDIFEYNIQKLIDDFGNKITFHPVYSIWNAHNLIEYYEFADKHNFRVNWQLALPKDDLSPLSTDSFIIFGHKASVIERAIQEIESLSQKDKSLLDIKNKLIDNIEIKNKDKSFLRWTEKMERLIPPVNTFKDLWPDLHKMLQTN